MKLRSGYFDETRHGPDQLGGEAPGEVGIVATTAESLRDVRPKFTLH